ncbi:MAG: gamma-glutamyl-gamma-aminobutyrate hydrolase family protein [Verrucomicrobia bacterium]|nr:gamma-glutamyl-gamma-aminobutyrate hydrolase family protein [Verrucomicrobiota bacterium]
MKTVYAIQHIHCETPGLIADALAAHDIALAHVRPFAGDAIPPTMGHAAGLVVMGGPMGVYEQDQHPFLRDEIELIQQALRDGKPVLGVCLGSQLLAAALGAPVTKGQQKEIGWFPVTLTRDGARDPLLAGVPASFTALHWHGDVFELPRGAVSLASSALTTHQAFRHGTNAYGFLFHMETTAPLVEGMVRNFGDELRDAGVNGDDILARASEHLHTLQHAGRAVFARWAALVQT